MSNEVLKAFLCFFIIALIVICAIYFVHRG